MRIYNLFGACRRHPGVHYRKLRFDVLVMQSADERRIHKQERITARNVKGPGNAHLASVRSLIDPPHRLP